MTGRFCFTHESGIHVAGLLENPETYQLYPPSLVGRHHEIIFGKHSGAQGVAELARLAGIGLADDGRCAGLARIKRKFERRKGSVGEEEILGWIRDEAGAAPLSGRAAGAAVGR